MTDASVPLHGCHDPYRARGRGPILPAKPGPRVPPGMQGGAWAALAGEGGSITASSFSRAGIPIECPLRFPLACPEISAQTASEAIRSEVNTLHLAFLRPESAVCTPSP